MNYLKNYVIVILILLFTKIGTAQSSKCVWLTDLQIGAPLRDSLLVQHVGSINRNENISFVLVSGNITDKGRTTELRQAKEILDGLKMKYYVIPGARDIQWSETAGEEFSKLWGNNKFCIELGKLKIIGLPAAIFRVGGGHFAPDDLIWLDSIITKSAGKSKTILVTNYSLESEVDNGIRAANIMSNSNFRLMMSSGAKENRQTNINNIPAVMSQPSLSSDGDISFQIVTINNDSIVFSAIGQDGTAADWAAVSLNEANDYRAVDTADFANYGTDISWKADIKRTLVAPLTFVDNKIYGVTIDGLVFCINQDGTRLWDARVKAITAGNVTVYQNIVLVTTIDGDIISYDAGTGKLLQSLGTEATLTSAAIIIKTLYRDEESDGFLVGTATGKILCLDFQTLNFIWENNSATDIIESAPIIVNDRIIFGSRDGYLYCIDAKTGILNWRWSENKNFYYAPAACIPQVDANAVYVVTPDGFAAKIDLLLGKTVWRKKDYNASESIALSSDKKKLFIKSNANKFFVINAADGKKLKEYNVKYGTENVPDVPIEKGAGIYFGTKSGIVYRVGAKESTPLFFMGNARCNQLLYIGANTFVSSNIDGKIVAFRVVE